MTAIEVERDGVVLSGEEHGEGPAVLLLHGFPDDRTLWRHQAPALARAGFRVILLDQRGFGRSGRPPDVAAYAFPELVGDVLAVLDHCGVERAHVVGHDWGAAVAWVLAATAPDRVDRLAVLSVGHPASFAAAGIEQLERSWYMLLFQFEGVAEEWLRADDWANLRAWSRHPELEQVIARLGEDGALTAALSWYRANRPPGALLTGPPALPPVQAPTMGVWGTEEHALTEASMTGSAAFVAGPWRYERLEGVGHFLPLEDPDAVTELLLDHLR